jgi:hypothetical protein
VTAFLAGLALLRCAEHERAADLGASARITLAAMATFAAESEDPPVCVASQDSIAARAGLKRRAVTSAIGHLEGLGLIKHDGQNGKRLSFTVRWRLELLRGTHGARKSDAHDARKSSDTPGTHETRKSDAHQTRKRGTHQTRNSLPTSSEGLPKDDGGLGLTPDSAGAPSGGPSPTNPRTALLAEVVARTGKSEQDAQRWMEERERAAKGPVRNLVAFIRRCLDTYESEPAKSPTEAKPVQRAGRLKIS